MTRTDRPGPQNLNRRRLIVLGGGAFVAAMVPFGRDPKRHLMRRNVPLMGTLAELAVVHEDRAYAHVAIDAAVAALRDVEVAMSRFDDASDVGQANVWAAIRPVPIGRDTAAVLREGLRWAVASDGRFDPCYGRAVELWDVTQRKTPPPDREIRRLAGRHMYLALELDSFRGSPVVRFSDADVVIDLGGVAKGFGVDRAVAALRNHGIRDALVNVGGDLYALGESENGDPWRIGIRDSADPTKIDDMFELADAAVATSGDYLRFFNHRGRRYHHLLDPATGEPFGGAVRSLTVTAANCMRADAAATTLFGMEASEADRLLRLVAPDARILNSV